MIDEDSIEWFKTTGLFCEVLTINMLFLQAIIVEMSDSLKKYFSSRQALIKTPF